MNVFKNNPYFLDENEGKTEIKSDTFFGACDTCFTYTREEELPFKPKQPIESPVFMSVSPNSMEYSKVRLEKDGYKKNRKFYIHTKLPLRVGDIIKVEKYTLYNYLIKSVSKQKDRNNNFIFEVVRGDGNLIVSFDIDKFKKGRYIKTKGYLTEKNQ